MSEWNLVWLVPVKLIPTIVFALVYVIGGRRDKWIRRWIGGTFVIVSCLFFSWIGGKLSFSSLSLFSLYLGLLLGYGGGSFLSRLFRRLAFGTVLGLCGLFIGVSYHVFWLGVFQMLLAIQSSVLLGLTNPDDAVDEEALIAIASVFVIPFMVL